LMKQFNSDVYRYPRNVFIWSSKPQMLQRRL